MCRTQCLSYCVPLLLREHKIWNILQMSLSSLVTWCSWWLLLLLCKLYPAAWSSMWLQDQWPSIFWVRQDLQTHQMLQHQLCSSIVGNCRLDLCTITFHFRTPEPSAVVSAKSYSLCRGQEYIVHNLQCFLANKIGISSVSDWQCRLKFAFSNNWINKRISNNRSQNWS